MPAIKCSSVAVVAVTPRNAAHIAALLKRLQPARLMSNMPMVRWCLNDDLKQAIGKLDYLGMSVGEALCYYHHVHSLKDMTTLNWSEQNALLDVGTAVAALFKWRESAVHQEMRQLFGLAAKGLGASIIGAQGNAGSYGPPGEVDDPADTREKDDLGPFVNAQGNVPAKGPHWELLQLRDTDPVTSRHMMRLGTAIERNVLAESFVDKVLQVIWESREVAKASTDLAAAALIMMESIQMPKADGAVADADAEVGSKPNKRTRARRKPAAHHRQGLLGLPGDQTDSEAPGPSQQHPGPSHQLPGRAAAGRSSSTGASAAAGPSNQLPEPGSKLQKPSLLQVAKAAKMVVRDVFLWRAAGEMNGFGSRPAFDKIIERFSFITDTRSQVTNGFRRQSENMGIKMQKPKRKPHQADEPQLDKPLSIYSETDDDENLDEQSQSAIRPPPGLELILP